MQTRQNIFIKLCLSLIAMRITGNYSCFRQFFIKMSFIITLENKVKISTHIILATTFNVCLHKFR